ncbi:MAG: C4-dicarboxylate ABC transporter, partial [Pseudomonadota bacterium]|nr:C4-dicarboxylate ABC transporter [Pseudomonadota bacterium]
NKAWWDKLPPSAQQVINEAARDAVAYQREVLYPDNEKAAREGFIKAGITIYDATDEDIEEFRKMTRPVWDTVTLPTELIQLVQDTQK